MSDRDRKQINPISQFISIPQNENDQRNPPEIINLLNVDYIQVFSEDKIIVNFASGTTKSLRGDRAKAFMEGIKSN